MKYIRVLAITWASFYLITGFLKSFTLNSVDFWPSVALLFCLFVFPLPIVLVGFWFQRAAGFALLLCGVASLAAGVIAAFTRASASISDKCTFLFFIVIWTIPHAAFALAYIFPQTAKYEGSAGK